MSQGFKVVIPARYGSTRLQGKPLLDIAGQPMIAHVCQRAIEADADEVIVATDDTRIFDTVNALGFKAIMTQASHQSGTERINEVAQIMGWSDESIIVNLQGDEPLLSPHYIKEVAEALANQSHAGIATLAARITHIDELFNTNTVKVVVNNADYAMYFSRAVIPWDREHFPQSLGLIASIQPYLRHIGLYAYTVRFLNDYCAWQPSIIEGVESLEQLRILWYGQGVFVKTVSKAPEAGVDTQADLERVTQAILQQP